MVCGRTDRNWIPSKSDVCVCGRTDRNWIPSKSDVCVCVSGVPIVALARSASQGESASLMAHARTRPVFWSSRITSGHHVISTMLQGMFSEFLFSARLCMWPWHALHYMCYKLDGLLLCLLITTGTRTCACKHTHTHIHTHTPCLFHMAEYHTRELGWWCNHACAKTVAMTFKGSSILAMGNLIELTEV